jgi:hypothetical protein
MAINAKILGNAMIEVAKTAAASSWKDVKPFAESQLRVLAQAAAEIETLLAAKVIDEVRARELFAVHRTSARAVLQAVTTPASPVAQVVTSVAAGVIRGALGSALGATAGKVTANFRAGKDL